MVRYLLRRVWRRYLHVWRKYVCHYIGPVVLCWLGSGSRIRGLDRVKVLEFYPHVNNDYVTTFSVVKEFTITCMGSGPLDQF